MADESSLLTVLSNNLHVKRHIIKNEHTHSKSYALTWTTLC